ncbi:MAG TPA: ribose-phosphate pyrophosphokinase [Symbiobacteriaceae bacterium]|nr:ribose-phosphate pyrophosphokinase [Symbiobacteriaceae bacterium]
MYAAIKVFAGKASEGLAAEVCRHLKKPLGDAGIMKFKNDNKFVQIRESVRSADVFVIQTSCPPVDENLMELLLMIDALKRASAERITAVMPYFPYVRSDKKDQPRIPLSARLVADLVTTAGANRVITIELHAAQIGGFFSIPLDHLTTKSLFKEYLESKGLTDPVVVATDAGGAKNALKFARSLGAPLAIMEKHRLGNTDEVEVTAFIGDVRGRQAIIYEDEISSGGTVTGAVDVLKSQGAAEVYVCATHGIFCGNAYANLARAGVHEVITTDTVPHDSRSRPSFVTELSVAPLLADAIRRVHNGDSVSDLFSY